MQLTHGMNIEQVEELGQFLMSRSEALAALAMGVENRVRSSSWEGERAELFRREWWPKHRAELQERAREISGLGQAALNNAAEQRRASDVTSIGSIGPGAAVGVGLDPTADPQLARTGRDRLADMLRLAGDAGSIPQGKILVRLLPDGSAVLVLPGVEDLTSSVNAGWRGAHLGGIVSPGGAIAGFIGGATAEAIRTHGSARDLRYTGPVALDPAAPNHYAEMVKRAMQEAGVPDGAKLLIVGHSGGAYAAAALAADPDFNGRLHSGGRYDVSHVIAVAADVDQFMPLVADDTNLMILNNQRDVVVLAEQATDGASPDRWGGTSGETPTHHEAWFTGTIKDAGHSPNDYARYLDGEDGAASLDGFAAGAAAFFAEPGVDKKLTVAG